jgi:predicted nucleic acid-binding protein
VRYLVDSDWLIDAAIGRPRPQSTLKRLSDQGVAVSIIAVAEVYEGAFGTPDQHAALAGLRDFLSDFVVIPLTDAIAERFARMRASLRRQGQSIPDMDLFIAATALEEDLILITRNARHFERIPELRLYQPG